jgi:PRTRC genetic system ThiF family protein
LISRINRFFGLQWQAEPKMYKLQENKISGNILITAVDKVAIRKDIGKLYDWKKPVSGSAGNNHYPDRKNFYWLDLGNSKTSGQIILGTRMGIEQPKKVKNGVSTLLGVTQMFPDLQKFEDKDDTPSCSLAEALTKQDLFINSILAQHGANLIWKMFREAKIQYHGLYVNLQNMTTNPIKVKIY